MPLSFIHSFFHDRPGKMLKNERALLLFGIMALLSSIMLWWTSTLSWRAFPDYVRLTDSIQLTRQSVAQAVILLERLQTDKTVDRQQVVLALEKAALNIDDCLQGRSNLHAIPSKKPSEKMYQLLLTYQKNLITLDRTLRTQLTSRQAFDDLQIQQLQDLSSLEQTAQHIETTLAENLSTSLAKQKIQQFANLVVWIAFLLFTFLLLLRALARETLQIRQQQLIQSLLDSTSDAIFIKDLAGKYLFCNEAVLAITGKTATELLGQDDRAVFSLETAEQIMELDQEILRNGKTDKHEERVVTTAGEQLNFAVAKGVIRDEEGNVTALFGISRDITAEAKMKEELHQHRALLERTSSLAKVGGWEFDLSTSQGSWTAECARIHDLSSSETTFSLEEVLRFYHSPYRERLEAAVHQAITEGIAFDLDLEMVSGSYRKKWVRIHCTPVMADGKVQYLYGALHDISDQKAAQQRLDEKEAALVEAQRLAEIGSWYWDIENDIHSFSAQTHHIFGHDPSQHQQIHSGTHRFFTQNSWQDLQKAVERCRQSGIPFICDIEAVLRDGRHRWVTVRGEAATDRDSAKIVALRGTVQDITERKQMENTLHVSEARYRNLFNQSMDAIAIVQESPVAIRLVNQAFVQLCGYDEDEIYSFSGARAWQLVHPQDHSIITDKILKPANRTKNQTYEFRLIRKDNETRWIESSSARIEMDGILMSQFILRDISQKKQAEKDQETLFAQLTQAQKMESVGRLAGGIAHDFNNMLSIILGRAEFAEAHLYPGSAAFNDIQEIKAAAQRSVDLTRQLLAFARRQPVAPKTIQINDTISGLMQMLHRLIGEDIELVWTPAPEIWQICIDPSQIDQILANICVNARDAIPNHGRITIETANIVFTDVHCQGHPGSTPGEYVLLSISDDGCGMEKDVAIHIFEPFFTTKALGQGTGLGLAMVYGIIKQNRGMIYVETEKNQGSTFRMYFPRCRTTTEPDSAKEPISQAKTVHGTVLLVEDEPALLALNQRMLTKLGYTVLTAETAATAIQLAQEYQGKIDLLLTDVIMPGKNGQELYCDIHRFLPEIKVIFMSGYTADAIAHHGVLDEGVNFLQKPFSKTHLADKIAEVIGKK